MFRSSLAIVTLAATLFPAVAAAGLPHPLPPTPLFVEKFMCIGVEGENAVGVSGTVFETQENAFAVPQDFVATVRADVELVVWNAGTLETVANTDLQGMLRAGMPTPGVAFSLAPDAEKAGPVSIIESLHLLKHVNGTLTATLKRAGAEVQTLSCQVLTVPSNL